MLFWGFVLIFLVCINFRTYNAFGEDKRRAKNNEWRISDHALIRLMLRGGVVGGYLGMENFHHKTAKFKFKVARVLSFVTFAIIIGLAFYTSITFKPNPSGTIHTLVTYAIGQEFFILVVF